MLSLMKKIQVVIIDKHTAVRRALAVRLGAYPNIKVVGTSGTLLDTAVLDEHPPDVAIVGLTGKNEDLLSVLDLVRRLTARGTAVLALASYIDDVAREMVLQAGASRYLLKDINTPQLLSEIEAVAAETKC